MLPQPEYEWESLTLPAWANIYVHKLEDHAKELERLLRRYRKETPLGHQPHMIAHEVDAALGDA